MNAFEHYILVHVIMFTYFLFSSLRFDFMLLPLSVKLGFSLVVRRAFHDSDREVWSHSCYCDCMEYSKKACNLID